MSKTIADTNELIRHAIEAWGYLVSLGSRMTLAEFAAVIRRHSSHERAEALAAALESATASRRRSSCAWSLTTRR